MPEDPLEQIRVKAKKFLPHQIFREDIKRARKKGFVPEGKHLFYRLSMSFEDAITVRESLEERVQLSRFRSDVEFTNLDHRDVTEFMLLYNTIFMAAPDPSRPIDIEEALLFPEDSTFIVRLWSMMAGFIYLVVEDDPLGSGESVGAIAGVGVLPKFRGRKLGLIMIAHAIDYFKSHERKINQLICEVYSENEPSLNMFKGLGMEIVGSFYLEDED
ncbi:MAG: GNAT family N-acetyltransferase [Candidatus Kariarchaeaceae archaeon]|jgi:ribosomal protein S18 acetylase RimI-like enzyme